MTQATDLGNIQNQLAQPYRQRVNTNFQAVVTQHYGAAEPAQLYPNMLWFSSGDGYIKLRNPTNSGWQNVGTIGPPMKWTNVDIPSTGWRAGDIKVTLHSAEAGWFLMNDGTIGDALSGATTRPNPDCWEAFAYLWGAGGLPLYAAGTWTQVGRSGDWVTDWNMHRHLQTPWVLGRALASQGLGAGMTVHRYWCASDGQESVTLNETQIPGHYHSIAAHYHTIGNMVDNLGNNTGNAFQYNAPSDLRITGGNTDWGGAGNTGWAGGNQAHNNIGPRVYFNFLMKL